MAFSRHNIEKRRLIDLVRHNPILWDCRLPHYKRSDKKKAIKWNELGRVFGVNGERVQRTFTSLREIFRRELNHEKMLGVRFKSKWEYYDAMAFLKEVIRERKSRERSKAGADAPNRSRQQTQPQAQSQLHNNNSSAIDEYQYFAPNDPNNPNNQLQHHQQQQSHQLAQALQQVAASLPMPLPPPPPLPMPLPMPPLPLAPPMQQQQNADLQQKQPVPLQQDLVSNLSANAAASLPTLPATGISQLPPTTRPPSQQQQQQQQQQQAQPTDTHVIGSSRSCSSSPSIYIKDEPYSPDDTISLATVAAHEPNSYSLQSLMPGAPPRPMKTAHLNGKHLPTTMNSNHNKNATTLTKTKDRSLHSTDSLIIDEDFAEPEADLDDLDDPDVDMLHDGRLSDASTYTRDTPLKPHRPSAREILYTKFGEFLAARLNTLNEAVSNDLMNRILLLIAEK